MEVVVLGAGTSVPIAGFSPASTLLKTSMGNALIDIGPGSLQQYKKHGGDYTKLNTLFLTHLHPDHTLDLITLLQAREYALERKGCDKLYIFGCVDTQAWLDQFLHVFPDVKSEKNEVSILEKGTSEWQWNTIAVSSIKTNHTLNSIAFRFDAPDGSVVVTGDAVMSDSLVDFCSGCDLLVCECSYPSGLSTTDHLDADMAGELARKSNTGHLVITHRYPNAIETDISTQIRNVFGGELSLASDGSTYTVIRSGA